jgi:hypothetical protein
VHNFLNIPISVSFPFFCADFVQNMTVILLLHDLQT